MSLPELLLLLPVPPLAHHQQQQLQLLQCLDIDAHGVEKQNTFDIFARHSCLSHERRLAAIAEALCTPSESMNSTHEP
jgi:hypothetical protein